MVSKRESVFIVSVFFSMFFMTFNIMAEEGPSFWAITETNLAIEENLVPEKLQSNYQASIKRYEYVLLALEVLEKNGDNIQIIYQRPFSDIGSHEYEQEIIKAYNAGIIDGYGDGTFKPDEEITRQEVAALIVKLIIHLDPYRDTRNNGDYTYADEADISSWATRYIDYCYNNGILKGTGTNSEGHNFINPKGVASIEQSILLMYRLCEVEAVLDPYDLGTIEVFDIVEGETTSSQSDTIDRFAVQFGEDMALFILSLSTNEDIYVTSIGEYSVSFNVSDVGRIHMYESGDKIFVKAYTVTPEDTLLSSTYNKILEQLDDSDQTTEVYIQSIADLMKDETITVNEQVGTNNYFGAYVYITDDISTYVFQYQYDVFSNY